MFRALLIPCAMLVVSVAVAQTAPPTQATSNDQWHAVPATASSSSYPDSTHAALPGDDKHSPFHFRQSVKTDPAYALPPQVNDKATVMGKQRPWENGRPPVDCRVDPRDPVCR